MAEQIACPFCGYLNKNAYTMQLHIEEHHTDGSPFVAHDKPANDLSKPVQPRNHESDDNNQETNTQEFWTKCTRPNCGEYVALADIDEHLDLHLAVEIAKEDNNKRSSHRSSRSSDTNPRRRGSEKSNGNSTGSPQKLRKNRPDSQSTRSGTSSLLSYFTGASAHGKNDRSSVRRVRRPEKPGRLGERELGPHAFERKMPPEVREELLYGARSRQVNRIGRDGRLVKETSISNETSGLVHILSDLCTLEQSTTATYLCHPGVKHVHKLPCEGNFCGYWNIQMLLSYLNHMNPSRPQQVPNVIQIQEVIEQAWSNGICPYGKIETGGVMNTRKWIGTHESLAFFTQIGIKVEALAFQNGGEGTGKLAVEDMLDYIEAYFMSGTDTAQTHGNSFITKLAPVYFQRLGHSMTIVGLERMQDGTRNLLVFDPSFATSEGMERLLAGRHVYSPVDTLLKAYRRSNHSLRRWKEFEIIVHGRDLVQA